MNAERADRFAKRAQRHAMRMIGGIVSSAVFLAVCMWAFIAWSLCSEYGVARAHGRTEGYNLTAAFASELTMTFDQVSAALRIIDTDIRETPPEMLDGEHLREVITAGGFTRFRRATETPFNMVFEARP